VFFVVPASELFGDPRPVRLGAGVGLSWALRCLLGFCMGPMQAASRTMIGRIAPEGMSGEFFGLFALSGRRRRGWGRSPSASSPRRPNPTGWAWRACFFLVLGFILLWRVREERAKV